MAALTTPKGGPKVDEGGVLVGRLKLVRLPGTVVAVALECCALVFLLTRPQAFSGAPAVWGFTLAVYLAFPLVTAGIGALGAPWGARVLLLKALVVFWATLPETALLPARWLVHGALAAQAASVASTLGVVGFVVGEGVELVLVQNVIPGMSAPPVDPVVTLLVIVLLAVTAGLVHTVRLLVDHAEGLAQRNDELHASVLQLTNANTGFLEHATTASEASAVSERHRITRELHDVVGQTLTNIIMMMDASIHRKLVEPDETLKLLRWIRKQAQTGLEETRSVLYELRALKPPRLGGLKALKRLVETFSRLSGIKTNVEWGNLPWRFHPDQEAAIYYLVQGALSNAFRHGSATVIDLHFRVDSGVLHVLVRDNGKGANGGSMGLGQKGMEERLARWGGSVGFRSEAFGYCVTAELPLEIPVPSESNPKEDDLGSP